ncbi:DNA helicase [Caulobacter phage BL199]|nr:DNA helicase [Caulobacter phage BL199]
MLKRREDHDKVIRAVPKHVLDIHTKTILEDFGKFFEEFPDADECDGTGAFWTWFYSFAHPTLNAEQRAHYQGLLAQINEPLPQSMRDGLMARLVEADTASKITTVLTDYNEGKEVNVAASLRTIMEQHEADTTRKVKTPLVTDDISDLLKQDAEDIGFHWRMEGLNRAMRPLRAGDFMILAARPDTGKTSAICDQVTYFASQMDTVFPPLDEDGNPDPVNGKPQNREVIWLNNEGMGNKIITRLYQAALNASITDLVKWDKEGTVKDRYIEALGGRDNIKVYDIHDFWSHEVEDILRTTNPGIIVFDMLDNIRFGGDVGNNGQRTDQLLEALYQWGRVRGVKYDSLVMATSQISADGENLAWPLLGMLKDSKTGKQGAADLIVTVGYKADYPNTRFIGCTKNKLVRQGQPKDPKLEVTFDGARSRYIESGMQLGATDGPAPHAAPAA